MSSKANKYTYPALLLTKMAKMVKITANNNIMNTPNNTFKIIPLLAIILVISGCSLGEEKIVEEKISRTDESIESSTENLKIVETIQTKNFTPNLNITANGTVESEEITIVQPEIAGRITNLKVKIGDVVKENQILATLGDSLSTDVSDIQNQASQNALEISKQAQELTEYSTIQSMNLAQRNLKLSEEAYKNSYQNIINTQNAFELQYDQANITIDNAELAYDQAKKAYKNATDATKSQLKLQRDLAENQLEQAETALDQLNANFSSQMSQLEYAMTAAETQYQNAQTQIESTYANLSLQKLQSESQLNQAQQGASISRANSNRKQITAQISGTITKVNVKENNLVTPGQAIIEIQNTKNLVVKTYISAENAALITKNDTVTIQTSGKKLQGKISYIATVLDPQTKKVEVKISLPKANVIVGAEAKVIFEPKTQNPLVPLNAVSIVNGKHALKVLEDNKVEIKEVTLGNLLNEYVEILEGITPTDEIIITTNTFLDEGETVKKQ